MRLSAHASPRGTQTRLAIIRAGTLARTGAALAAAEAGRSRPLLPTRLRVVRLVQRAREGAQDGTPLPSNGPRSIGLTRSGSYCFRSGRR
jgi:hypothetical protein